MNGCQKPKTNFVYYLVLQRIWDFEKDIASICWNDTEAKGKDQRNSTELLVGTVDGRVWNVALLNPAEAPIPPKTSIDSELRTVIKIEDDEEKDLEEIELWNDEDGLLDGFDQLQDVSEPPLKRQRIGLSSSQISPEFDKQQESRVETIKISEYNNLVGSEVREIEECSCTSVLCFLASVSERFSRTNIDLLLFNKARYRKNCKVMEPVDGISP